MVKPQNVKLIEDRHSLIKQKLVTITEKHMLVGPDTISEIEYWEERLDKIGIPYVTAQFEVTVDCKTGLRDSKGNAAQRYLKGYGLFVQELDISGLNKGLDETVESEE